MYTKPQVLNVKKASSTILGMKQPAIADNGDVSHPSTATAYRSDE
jgi:hypothetical protein